MHRRFRFESAWSVGAPPGAVRDVLVDLEYYPYWWPQVRAVAKIGPDDARVLCRSTLPYTLDLVLHAVSRELPRIEVEIDGDLVGRAAWTVMPEGEGSRMQFEQEVELVRMPSVAIALGRPVMAWNHRRMMAGCRAGLERRLARSSSAGPT